MQRVALELGLAREPAVHAVVAEQVRVGGGRGQVVDRHHLDVVAAVLGDRPQHVAPDPAEPVDGYLRGHRSFSLAGAPRPAHSRTRPCAGRSSQRSLRTEQTYEHENPEPVCYLSPGFLIGRSRANNIRKRYRSRRRSTSPRPAPPPGRGSGRGRRAGAGRRRRRSRGDNPGAAACSPTPVSRRTHRRPAHASAGMELAPVFFPVTTGERGAKCSASPSWVTVNPSPPWSV